MRNVCRECIWWGLATRATFLLMVSLALSFSATAQVKISGIVIDSVTFKAIPDVHIRIKDKAGTTSDKDGNFNIVAKPFDTLTFSRIGYLPVRFPVLLDEEDIMIVMAEDVTYLLPVTVTALARSPLIRDKAVVTPRVPKAAPLATGAGIAFDYFSRAQRERRKLQRLLLANEKVHSYNLLITDPDFKDEIVSSYALTDEEYYNAVLAFNTNYLASIEYKTIEEATTILHDYFCRISVSCP
ncbi:MAG TPA: carboxypeptidase-like regulatory domain-containing protein [Cyclobacteriaceae bacterium]|nr:carboxypeptidase-like regulatory domain-containing protein [Cyclobacteriaceae bacterium]